MVPEMLPISTLNDPEGSKIDPGGSKIDSGDLGDSAGRNTMRDPEPAVPPCDTDDFEADVETL